MELKGRIVNYQAIAGTTVSGTTTVNGTAINKTGFESLKVVCYAGAVVGAAPAGTITFQLQESSNNSDWANVTTSVVYPTSAVLSTVAGVIDINKNLTHVKKYIRVTATPAYTGGSSPYQVAGAIFTLGMSKVLPQ